MNGNSHPGASQALVTLRCMQCSAAYPLEATGYGDASAIAAMIADGSVVLPTCSACRELGETGTTKQPARRRRAS